VFPDIGGVDGHGSSSDNVWVTTLDRVYQWNGSTWTEHNRVSLTALWVRASDDVWAAGSHVAHWNGTDWTTVDVGVDPASYHDILVFGDNDIWLAGGESIGSGPGLLVHYDGSSWNRIDVAFADKPIPALWGTSSTDLWVLSGSGAHHFDGDTFTQFYDYISGDTVPNPNLGGLAAIAGRSQNDVWAVGEEGIILQFNGTQWRNVDERITATGIAAGVDSDGRLWVSGDEEVWRSGLDGWTRIELNPEGDSPLSINAYWLDPKGTLWAVGTGIWKIRGGEIESLENLSLPPFTYFVDVWGTSANDIWAAGGTGDMRVAHYDGSTWSPRVDGLYAGDYNAIRGLGTERVWTGGGADLWRFDGSTWVTEIDGLGAIDIEPVSENCLWLVTGAVWRWRPSPDCVNPNDCLELFSLPQSGSSLIVSDLYARSCDEAWVVGEPGLLWKVSSIGVADPPVGAITDKSLRAISSMSDGRLVVVGDGGTVLTEQR
jgi:hypothetical protein